MPERVALLVLRGCRASVAPEPDPLPTREASWDASWDAGELALETPGDSGECYSSVSALSPPAPRS